MNARLPYPFRHLLLALAVLALALFACSLPGRQGGSAANQSNLLPDPSVGLAGLQSYHAVYDLTVQGSLDGAPLDRQSHMDDRLVTASGDEELLWQEEQSGSTAAFQHTLKLGSAVYTRSQDGQSCWSEEGSQPQEPVVQPSGLLPAVSRASRLGDETVNGVAATHYRFDQSGLSLQEPGVSGEVWIARQGGYVVKYTLSIPAPAAPTGKGVEVEEQLSYELQEVNAVDAIELPAGCVPVPVDLPVMSDAQDLLRGSGMLDYTTPSKVEDVIAFYNQALPAQGWTSDQPGPAPIQGDTRALEYKNGDQRLSLILDGSGESLEVTAVLYNPGEDLPEATAAPGPSPTPGELPTIDASQSGLPDDVPLYPGATGLKALPQGVMFTTADPPDSVAAYYRQKLQAFKWSLMNEAKPSSDRIVQAWSSSTRMLAVMIQTDGLSTTVTLMLSNHP